MAHYLTFDSSVTCTVNGTSVSSGYELHDGDVIVVGSYTAGALFAVNDDGTTYYANNDTVDIYDNDVDVYAFGGATNE